MFSFLNCTMLWCEQRDLYMSHIQTGSDTWYTYLQKRVQFDVRTTSHIRQISSTMSSDVSSEVFVKYLQGDQIYSLLFLLSLKGPNLCLKGHFTGAHAPQKPTPAIQASICIVSLIVLHKCRVEIMKLN